MHRLSSLAPAASRLRQQPAGRRHLQQQQENQRRQQQQQQEHQQRQPAPPLLTTRLPICLGRAAGSLAARPLRLRPRLPRQVGCCMLHAWVPHLPCRAVLSSGVWLRLSHTQQVNVVWLHSHILRCARLPGCSGPCCQRAHAAAASFPEPVTRPAVRVGRFRGTVCGRAQAGPAAAAAATATAAGRGRPAWPSGCSLRWLGCIWGARPRSACCPGSSGGSGGWAAAASSGRQDEEVWVPG